MADLYFAYGKALLENAVSQSSVLGKEQAEDPLGHDKGTCSVHVIFTEETNICFRRCEQEWRVPVLFWRC